jgi:hypothetical protein
MADRDLNQLAHSATKPCLTGCAIGEFSGMALGTAFAWGDISTMALAIGLAYLFGFGLMAMPLFRAKLAPRKIVSTCTRLGHRLNHDHGSDRQSDGAGYPRALAAGLDDPLFYGSIALGFAIAYPFAFWASRYLIARGRGHAVLHEYH